MIAVAYEEAGDDSLYFYAYEKGKILGFLNFGKSQTIRFKNVYLPHKGIPKIVAIEFIDGKNGIIVLLSDEIMLLTFKKSPSSLAFMIKKRVKLWELPLPLVNST